MCLCVRMCNKVCVVRDHCDRPPQQSLHTRIALAPASASPSASSSQAAAAPPPPPLPPPPSPPPPPNTTLFSTSLGESTGTKPLTASGSSASTRRPAQAWQKIRPQRRQWWRRRNSENRLAQPVQVDTLASGTHVGSSTTTGAAAALSLSSPSRGARTRRW